MRGWLSIPVLDGVTGSVAGKIPPRQGLKTSCGTILRYEGGRCFTFVDENGVLSRHQQAEPWVEEDEARRWGFTNHVNHSTTAMAV